MTKKTTSVKTIPSTMRAIPTNNKNTPPEWGTAVLKNADVRQGVAASAQRGQTVQRLNAWGSYTRKSHQKITEHITKKGSNGDFPT